MMSFASKTMGALAMGSRSLASRQSPLSAVSAAAQSLGGVRFLNLHEYQSKEVMEKFNVVVQKGDVADSAEKARKVAEWIKNDSTYCCRTCCAVMFALLTCGGIFPQTTKPSSL